MSALESPDSELELADFRAASKSYPPEIGVWVRAFSSKTLLLCTRMCTKHVFLFVGFGGPPISEGKG